MSNLKLRVRAYEATTPGFDRWRLIGAADRPDVVADWVTASDGRGLLIHTGFSVLDRDSLVPLIEASRSGVVVCMASQALIGGLFSETNQGVAPLEVSGVPFLIHPMPGAQLETVPLTTAGTGSAIEQVDPFVQQCIADGLVSSDAAQAVGIFSESDLYACWEALPEPYVTRLSRAFLAYHAEKHPLMKTQRRGTFHFVDAAATILDLAQYLTPAEKDTLPQISARLDNALRSAGVRCVYDLLGFTPRQLAMANAIGQKSLNQFLDYFVDVINDDAEAIGLVDSTKIKQIAGTAQQDTDEQSPYNITDMPTIDEFLDAVQDVVSTTEGIRIKERDAQVFSARLSGMTLEEVGAEFDVTRERIRQIVGRVIHKTHNVLQTSQQGERLTLCRRYVATLRGVLSDSRLLSFGDSLAFAGQMTPTSRDTQKAFLTVLLANLAGDLEVVVVRHSDYGAVFLPSAKSLDSQINYYQVTMQSLRRSVGRYFEEAVKAAGYQLQDDFGSQNIALTIVRYVAVKECRQDDDGIIQSVGPRLASDESAQFIVDMLRTAGKPLHGEEDIYPGMPDVFLNQIVDPRRIFSLLNTYSESTGPDDPDQVFSVGRGQWALWEHAGLTDEQAQDVAAKVEQILAESPDRQFSDWELYEELRQRSGYNWEGDRVFKYRKVSMVLQRVQPANVRNLGRFNWQSGQWVDQPDTGSRHQFNDMIRELILKKQRPVTRTEINEYTDSRRGSGISAQIHPTNGLVKLMGEGKAAIYWHEALDPLAIDHSDAMLLADEALNILRSSDSILLARLRASIVRQSETLRRYEDWALIALLLRQPGISMTQGDSGALTLHHTTEELAND